jgi:N-methylhydantoinase A/oxoprolinase/acetone carboxylase beta subunit
LSSQESVSGKQGERRVIFDHGQQSLLCPILLRDGLKVGDRVNGPAVIEELGATILLYPGDKIQVNEFGHLVIDVAV